MLVAWPREQMKTTSSQISCFSSCRSFFGPAGIPLLFFSSPGVFFLPARCPRQIITSPRWRLIREVFSRCSSHTEPLCRAERLLIHPTPPTPRHPPLEAAARVKDALILAGRQSRVGQENGLKLASPPSRCQSEKPELSYLYLQHILTFYNVHVDNVT